MTKPQPKSMTVPLLRVYATAPSDPTEKPKTKVHPEVLDMNGFPSGEQVLVWKIQTDGFVFEGDGITFNDEGVQTFSKATVSPDLRIASVINLNNDGLAYSYTVAVKNKVTGVVTRFDPLVQNEGK